MSNPETVGRIKFKIDLNNKTKPELINYCLDLFEHALKTEKQLIELQIKLDEIKEVVING